jgi:hypothetical protein
MVVATMDSIALLKVLLRNESNRFGTAGLSPGLGKLRHSLRITGS